MFNDCFIANFFLTLTVTEFGKSVNIRQSYGQEYSVSFFFTHFVFYDVCNYRLFYTLYYRESPIQRQV